MDYCQACHSVSEGEEEMEVKMEKPKVTEKMAVKVNLIKKGSWAGIREFVKEDKQRKQMAEKPKERYTKACQKYNKYPLSCVLKAFETTSFQLASQKIGPEHTKAMAIALVRLEYVTGLDLSDNCLGDDGIFYVSDLLPINQALTYLNVSKNSISLVGMKALVAALAENINIKKLDISGNELQEEGGFLIAELLQTLNGITELKASGLSVGEAGGVPIGQALAENDTLEILDLSWNHIRNKGAIAIGHALKTNTCLRVLNLAWNGFGKEGGKAVGDGLATNNSLTELDLTNNRLEANAMAVFMSGLNTNTALQVLKLGKNPFNCEVAKYLLMVIEQAESSALTNLELDEVSVDKDFVGLLEKLQATRAISIRHGRVVGTQPEKPYEPPPLPPRDPLEMMFEFKYENGYRTLDLMNRMDKDNDMALDRTELKYGLRDIGIEVDEDQIRDILERLDTNNDGQIDYGELMQGEKEYGSRTKRHTNSQTLQKIRTLASTLVKLKLTTQLKQQEQSSKTPESGLDTSKDDGKTGSKKTKRKLGAEKS